MDSAKFLWCFYFTCVAAMVASFFISPGIGPTIGRILVAGVLILVAFQRHRSAAAADHP